MRASAVGAIGQWMRLLIGAISLMRSEKSQSTSSMALYQPTYAPLAKNQLNAISVKVRRAVGVFQSKSVTPRLYQLAIAAYAVSV